VEVVIPFVVVIQVKIIVVLGILGHHQVGIWILVLFVLLPLSVNVV
jgi:hypothetical protein